MINLLTIFASGDGKQLLFLLISNNFLALSRKKCPKDAEDVEICKLCQSAPLHPVRCPEARLNIQSQNIANTKCITSHTG